VKFDLRSLSTAALVALQGAFLSACASAPKSDTAPAPAATVATPAAAPASPSPAPAAAATTPAAAATAVPAKVPTAREIVDRYVAAIGGRDQILKHGSRRVTGTLEIPAAGLTGAMTAVSAKPNRMAVTINIPGLGDMRQGYDGTVGWSLDPTQGPMVLSGKALDQRKQQAQFYSELHDAKDYASMETVGLVDFNGAQAYKVKLVRANGDSTFELFDPTSGLMVGMISTQDSPMGAMTITSTIGDYKPFGGIQVATKSTQTFATGQKVNLTVSNVEYDVVDPKAFELPTEIKTLSSGAKK